MIVSLCSFHYVLSLLSVNSAFNYVFIPMLYIRLLCVNKNFLLTYLLIPRYAYAMHICRAVKCTRGRLSGKLW